MEKQNKPKRREKKSFWRSKGLLYTLVTGVVASLIAAIIMALSPSLFQYFLGIFKPDPSVEVKNLTLLPHETIIVQSVAILQDTPRSFCVTEDELFFIPNIRTETIMIFEKNKNYLNYKKALKLNKVDNGEIVNPTYCSYSRNEKNESKLGVICDELRKISVFKRTSKYDFNLDKEIDCKSSGTDIEFTEDSKQLIVSGYLADKKGNPFDLYSVNIETGQTDYLLASYKKYGLKTRGDYGEEYSRKQTLPAIGIKGFFDVQGNNLFFVWEGALRIIKLDLRTKEITKVFGHETPYYTKPDGSSLMKFYKEGNSEELQNQKEMIAYLRQIFVTRWNIFLVIEAGKDKIREGSRFILQIYTLNGDFLGDHLLSGTPDRPMWFDKKNDVLYAFSQKSKVDNGTFSILKYKIKI